LLVRIIKDGYTSLILRGGCLV